MATKWIFCREWIITLLNVDTFFSLLHCLSTQVIKISFFFLVRSENSRKHLTWHDVKKQGFAFAYVFFFSPSPRLHVFYLLLVNLALEFVFSSTTLTNKQKKSIFIAIYNLQQSQSARSALVFKNVSWSSYEWSCVFSRHWKRDNSGVALVRSENLSPLTYATANFFLRWTIVAQI